MAEKTVKFTLKIDSGNAAFQEDPHREVARVLKGVAKELEDGSGPDLAVMHLFDVNGNRVGCWSMDVDGGTIACEHCGTEVEEDEAINGEFCSPACADDHERDKEDDTDA